MSIEQSWMTQRAIALKDDPPQLLRESFRCTADEKSEVIKEAEKRGMTFSQLVRLAVKDEIKWGGK